VQPDTLQLSKKVMRMNQKTIRTIRQVVTYLPLAGIIGASFLNLTAFQHQLLMLFLLLWANAFFLYRSWLN
jgi:hypothetical protein